tara:strand:- start:558 stop:878 length:321 start_codon:yes stop_codon:yes gene_type:complete
MKNTNKKNTVKIATRAHTTILYLGEFGGETVIVSVPGEEANTWKDLRHVGTFDDAFALLERVQSKLEINLEHWRELNSSEAETVAEERAYHKFTDHIEANPTPCCL